MSIAARPLMAVCQLFDSQIEAREPPPFPSPSSIPLKLAYSIREVREFVGIRLLAEPGRPALSSGAMRSQAASLNTKRSITPKAASQKEALNLICSQKGILRVHTA